MENLNFQLIILLAIWVFILQNKINKLKQYIQNLEDKLLNLHLSQVANIQAKEKSPPKTKSLKDSPSLVKTKEEKVKSNPSPPSPKEKFSILVWIIRYFSGGNLLVRVGGVVLFFGLAFLVKYTAEHSHLSIELRLGAITVIGLGLLLLGWRLKARTGAYGQILQGVGIATLYLTIFASTKFYHLITPTTAFALMLLLVIFASGIALKQDSLAMILFATAGGFLVPILTSTDNGSYPLLFGYYALLDIGIFLIAWKKSWRILNIVGFAFTFVIATIWGVLKYHSNLFWTTEPFLILYYAIYLTISILYTLKRHFEPKNLIDSTLVFGLPLIAFPLQLSLVRGFEYGEAISSIALGTIYLLLSLLLRKRQQADLLVSSFMALTLIFYTISIAYLFDRDVTVSLWSLEGSAMLWSAIKQNRQYTRYFSLLLLLISFSMLKEAHYWEYLIAIASALFSSYWLDRAKKSLSRIERHLAPIFAIWAVAIYLFTTPKKLEVLGIDINFAPIFALVIAGVTLYLINRFFKWQRAIWLLQAYWVVAFFLYPYSSALEQEGLFAWILLNIVGYFILYSYDKEYSFATPLHILALWFNVTILTLELDNLCINYWHSLRLDETIIGLIGIIFSFTILLWKRYPKWLQRYKRSYHLVGAGGINIAILAYIFHLFALSNSSKNYLPLFNLIDIMQILSVVSLWVWVLKNIDTLQKFKTLFYALVSFISLLSLSAIYARAIHHYRHIPYNLSHLWESLYFQTGLSLLWSLAGISLMLLSKNFLKRSWWIGGFVLLLLVVTKLFFVELSGSGTIERIVSFISVGLLLLLIGYFVPLPPKKE